MARRTVHIPDDLDRRVIDHGDTDDSYSSIVQDALRAHLEQGDRSADDAAEQPAD